MSGLSAWQKKIELDISTAQKQLETLEKEVNNKQYTIDIGVNKEQLESTIANLDKMLKSLGKGTGDFKQFENLTKELTAVTSEVKDLSNAFGKIDGNSGAKNLLSSIQSIDASLTTLTKHITEANTDFGNIGKNANANVGQIQNAQKATEGLASATENLAKAQSKVSSNKTNLSSGGTEQFASAAVDGQEKLQESISATENRARELMTVLTEGKDIISQSWLKELRAIMDDNGNVTGYEGSFSYLERLQDGQLQRTLMTWNNETKEWVPTVQSLNTNFEQVANQIIKADNQINKLTTDMNKTKAAYPNYDTTADEELIRLTQQRRDELQKTLNLYAQQDEYCTDTQTQQQRILENQQRLNTEIQKQNNIQTAKSSNADSKAITQATRQLAKYEQQLNHIQMTYDSKANNDLEKPVTNAKDLNELETKRLEIETKINNLKGQKRDSSTEQEFLEVEKLLKEYQEIAAYKKKANNPTTGQLGGKSTEVASAEEVAKYDALIEKARKYGTITDETIAKLEELRAKLVSVDSSGTKTYNDDSSVYYSARDDRTVYTAEIKSATSLLEQQENSLQRILKLRTDIKTAESNGQNTTALKQELATEQAIHKSLGEQLSVYDNIISNEKRRAEALQTVATYESNLSKVQGKNETDTGLEKSKQKYQEIIALINQYKEVGTRVNGNKALEGDVEDLERLDNKISEVLSEALNAGTLLPNHINKINESINNVSHSLDTVQRKTEQTSTNSMFSSWESSLEKFQNKLNTFKIKPDDEHIFDSWKQKLIDLQKQIDEYKTAIQDIQKNDGIVSPAEEKRVKNLEKDLENTIKQMEKGVTLGERGWTDDGVSKMAEKLNKYLQENTRMSKEAKAAIQKYYNQLVSGNPTKPLKEIDAECLTIIQHEREAGRAGKSWLDILKDKAFYNNISQIVSMYFSVYSIINKLGETVETVRELDTALTEMRKVSDETVSSLKAFQQTTFEIADDIGTTALELQDATASYMRLGESLEQASESAKDTTILLNVSEFDNIDDATESLIAMSQAYTDLDKMDIINKLNQVGNNYSISTDEAASALQKSASALKTAGNSMDEALALVTAGNAVVQDADSVGAGMRTIALRLVGTSEGKEQLEELGEDTEGYIESVSKLRDTIKDATKAAAGGEGFDILDANGNYKSTYEIMEGLSDLYDDIVKKDKELGTNNLNLLLETIAGEIFAREMIEIHFQRTYLTALIA